MTTQQAPIPQASSSKAPSSSARLSSSTGPSSSGGDVDVGELCALQRGDQPVDFLHGDGDQHLELVNTDRLGPGHDQRRLDGDLGQPVHAVGQRNHRHLLLHLHRYRRAGGQRYDRGGLPGQQQL